MILASTCVSVINFSSKVATQLRFLARPREMIVLYKHQFTGYNQIFFLWNIVQGIFVW